MQQKLKLLLGVHCHQPVGNFEHIFEAAYEQAYLPFIQTLTEHPKIKFSVHYSGVLYDWFKEKQPAFIELLKKLVKRGQLEILSSGYYEPILPLIPDEDKIGQIEMTNMFIKENFWRAPRGLWLTERVWEPTLPKVLAQTGIEYALVDDDHFIRSGIAPDKLFGYYLTEDEGKLIKLFSINRTLRELIPFQPPEKTIEYLGRLDNHDGSTAVVFMDDGEKFGFRPGTDKQYLERLLDLLEANSDWLEFTTFSNYLDEYEARGRIYLPSLSYLEMMRWIANNHGQGDEANGYFRNFLVKYPEANNMHKKMLFISKRLQTLKKGKSLIDTHQRAERLKIAEQELFKGQCSCAYWHGLFGGLYLNNLRHAVYSHLIKAEIELEKFNRGGKPYVELTITDFDKDGADEVILSNKLINLYFSAKQGGALFELDYKPKTFNLINTLHRQAEPYHQPSLIYDRQPRFCLIDHFLGPETGLDNFSSGQYREVGDFINAKYNFMPGRKNAEVSLDLGRTGQVEGLPVKVDKKITLLAKQSLFNIEYQLINLGDKPDLLWFGVEFNLSLLAGNSTDRYFVIPGQSLENKSLMSLGENEDVRLLKIIDGWNKFDVSLEFDRPALLWRFPIETVSQSETGLEKNYQGSVILPSWKISLGPRETWQVKFSFRIEE